MAIFGGLGVYTKLDNGRQLFNDAWIYNAIKYRWSPVVSIFSVPIPPRRGHAMVILGDIMIVYGGYGKNDVCYNDFWSLNL